MQHYSFVNYRIFYFICIVCLFFSCSLTRENKISKNKKILLKDERNYFSNFNNLIYIPNTADSKYYKSGHYEDCCDKPELGMVKKVKAFYDLYKILTPEDVKELLYDPSPVLRVYAYFYYIGKFEDINIEYIKKQIESKEEISVNNQRCYIADPMMLAAIGRISIQFMFFTEFMKINPTREQRDDLYERYLKRGKHEDFDLTYEFERANIEILLFGDEDSNE